MQSPLSYSPSPHSTTYDETTSPISLDFSPPSALVHMSTDGRLAGRSDSDSEASDDGNDDGNNGDGSSTAESGGVSVRRPVPLRQAKGEGKAIEILTAFDVDLVLLRKKLEQLNPANPTFIDSTDKPSLRLTRQAEKALKTTFLEAKLYQSDSIDTAHLLLCILRNENDPTTKLIHKYHVKYDEAKSLYKQLHVENEEDVDLLLITRCKEK